MLKHMYCRHTLSEGQLSSLMQIVEDLNYLRADESQ